MSAHANPEVNVAPARKSLVSKLKIPGIILGIVALEWAMALLVMPSSDSTAPIAPAMATTVEETAVPVEEAADHGDAAASSHDSESHADDKHGKTEKHDDGHGHDKADDSAHGAASTSKPASRHSDAEEVDLGNFTVSGFQPASNSTLFITFHLYGTVRHKYADEFSERLEENKHRIRDNIIVIIRSADITDLTDAGLGLIKRRILETTNRTLGKPLLQEVVFSEFSFIEQ